MELDWKICERARLAKDRRFDGLFYTAVKSTGIFCRPICPAPSPNPENVVYYRTAVEAIGAGFRPCLRCCPESAPGNPEIRASTTLAERILEELNMIESDGSFEEISAKLGISVRHMRRVFLDKFGVSPVKFRQVNRALFAKKLLTDTDLPVAQIAFHSGFRSVRQFNDVFRKTLQLTPMDIRKEIQRYANSSAGTLKIKLAYRGEYDWCGVLRFLKTRQVDSVEKVSDFNYIRGIRINETQTGWIKVFNNSSTSSVDVELHLDEQVNLLPLQQHLRNMFDLDSDVLKIRNDLSADMFLSRLIDREPAVRLVQNWDFFEGCVRSILGQQISLKAANTLTQRLVLAAGIEFDSNINDSITHLFPTAEQVLEADLAGIGLTGRRLDTLLRMAEQVSYGLYDELRLLSTEETVTRLCDIKGIGTWTANYIAMRCLGKTDALPLKDLGILRAFGKLGKSVTMKEVEEHANRWKPWRSYATYYLWRMLEETI